jgi:hypothetical protein
MFTKMKRKILNEGNYTATIFRAEMTTSLDLIWIVDSGEDKGAKLFQSFESSSKHAVERFEKLCLGLMFFMPKLYQLTQNDADKLVGLRAEIKVLIAQSNNVLKNIIASYAITETPPELDVFEVKTDEVFRIGSKQKKLPIC